MADHVCEWELGWTGYSHGTWKVKIGCKHYKCEATLHPAEVERRINATEVLSAELKDKFSYVGPAHNWRGDDLEDRVVIHLDHANAVMRVLNILEGKDG